VTDGIGAMRNQLQRACHSQGCDSPPKAPWASTRRLVSTPRGSVRVAAAFELPVERLSLEAEDARRCGLVPCHGFEHSQDVAVIAHEEHAMVYEVPCKGRYTRNSVPLPRTLFTSIQPPWSRTIP
jgi:hypothetical protein